MYGYDLGFLKTQLHLFQVSPRATTSSPLFVLRFCLHKQPGTVPSSLSLPSPSSLTGILFATGDWRVFQLDGAETEMPVMLVWQDSEEFRAAKDRSSTTTDQPLCFFSGTISAVVVVLRGRAERAEGECH